MSNNLDNIDADEIAQCCLNLFTKLPKSGKPIENEWTVLSCIVQYDINTEKLEVVSLGTGTKCIGASQMSPNGDILNDSHAEVIARRGFLFFLYNNIDKAAENKTDSIFIKENSRYKLKENIKFIFYSSQLPCGDASILPKSEEEQYGNILRSNKRKADDNIVDMDIDNNTPSDIHRTGAKCLPQNEQDCRESGAQYHLLGQVRTKPGRGIRSSSVSCSDKIAKWIHMGLQGRLFELLLVEPIFIEKFVFGGGVPYSKESLTRALLRRDANQPVIAKFVPEFHQTSLVFPCLKSEVKVTPAPGSIIWINVNEGYSEVAVQGKKLGVTRINHLVLKNLLCISKFNLYRKFQNTCNIGQVNKTYLGIKFDTPYNKMKAKASRYEEHWQFVKRNFFKTWTIKPDMWDFSIKW